MRKDRPLCIKEIAHELGCSTKTVRRYHASGKLKTFRVGEGASPIKMRSIDLKRYLERKGK